MWHKHPSCLHWTFLGYLSGRLGIFMKQSVFQILASCLSVALNAAHESTRCGDWLKEEALILAIISSELLNWSCLFNIVVYYGTRWLYREESEAYNHSIRRWHTRWSGKVPAYFTPNMLRKSKCRFSNKTAAWHYGVKNVVALQLNVNACMVL